ncbi:MAG: sigma 54-interacting transcriptional regulator [Alcaligenaceae bacterium]|nr:sigma 54-interacting transcriptional regulator [Alcaligenaceae bacterium]
MNASTERPLVPSPTHWKSAAINAADQYLEIALEGLFQVAVFDEHGQTLYRSSGSRSTYVEFNTSMLPRAQHASVPTTAALLQDQSSSPRFYTGTGIPDSGRCAWMKLAFSDSTDFHWLAFSTTSQYPDTQILAVCELFGKLLIRERDAADTATRAYETIQQQEAIINHISDGLLVLDRDGVLKHCNDTAAKLLNFSPQACIGRPLSEALDFDLAISDVFEKKEGYLDREMQINSPRLRVHLVDTAIPVLDDSGEIVSVVNTFRRIERVKELSYRIAMDRAHYRFSDIIGFSEAISDCIAEARKAAQSDANVVLFGESGTGKEIFAQAIHADSRRAGGPFVAVNCASLPRDLVESELFGYMSGSFTGADKAGRPGKFEMASGGTLFLDEIAEMPLDVQAKLLRVLQEKRVQRIGAAHTIPVDLHVIAASHRRLATQVADGRLREDLYYRLNVIEVNIPALRERVNDIPVLVETFLKKHERAHDRNGKILSNYAMQQLLQYRWPGNVRELQNIAERIVHLYEGKTVDKIPDHWFNIDRPDSREPLCVNEPHVRTLTQIEEQAIHNALKACKSNITQAASALGTTRPTLYAKMKRYGISVDTYR